MADFKVIETQEEFESRLKDRLERERETVRKEFEGYEDLKTTNKSLQKQIDTLNSTIATIQEKSNTDDSTIAELNGKIKGYEQTLLKSSIAHEFGIPHELANKLSGDDEQSLREDAKTLAGFVKQKQIAPRKDLEPSGNNENAAYMSLLSSIKEGE